MNIRARHTVAGISSVVLGAAVLAAQPAAAFAATTPTPTPLPGLSCSVNQGLDIVPAFISLPVGAT